MQNASRRWLLKSAASYSSLWLWGCGGGTVSESAQSAEAGTAPSTGTPASRPASAAAPFAAGKYRFNQGYLLQGVPSKTIPARLPEGSDFLWDIFGPTYTLVDKHSGWLWTQPGGDWLDANGTRHGSVPWFAVPTDKAIGATAVASYSVDVTQLAQHCQRNKRWFALMLFARNAARVMAGRHHSTQAPPHVDVIYTNGQSARLSTRVSASSSKSSTLPNSTAAELQLPVFIEFDAPQSEVASAALFFVLTQHWSGSNPRVEGFLLDPPMASDSIATGLAATAGALDGGIEKLPSVLGVHRYLDGSSLTDFAHAGASNWTDESNYDPAIYDNGPSDLNKFPHAGQGKWINAGKGWSIVGSDFGGEGFKPLAPGLGALRIEMPASAGVKDGAVVGSSGTTAGNGMIFLPESLYGRLGRIFVRYYFRIGTPYAAQVAKRYQVYQTEPKTEWTTYAGKFGITPDHATSSGGVSGSSGGGHGWQMRLSWYECDAGLGGPDEGGWAPGFHLYDFYYQNPPGHNYGHGDGNMPEHWGQRGGVGGMLYAGQWYCIEHELKLNTVMPESPGFLADGEIRAWVDGRLAYERTGMVFRTLPVVMPAFRQGSIRPCRELGVRGIWLNWFHGGKTVATFDRTSFYTGLVWSREYIGPMKLP